MREIVRFCAKSAVQPTDDIFRDLFLRNLQGIGEFLMDSLFRVQHNALIDNREFASGSFHRLPSTVQKRNQRNDSGNVVTVQNGIEFTFADIGIIRPGKLLLPGRQNQLLNLRFGSCSCRDARINS